MRKLCIVLTLLLLLCGCSERNVSETEGLRIVTTLFPTYDFARTIAGGKADIKLLLTPGRESHSYEPSTGDVIDISESDIFIYTGESMEPWAARIVENMDGPTVVDASKDIELEKHEDDGHGHNHDREHSIGLDPHIWTDPHMCLTIVDNILAAFVERDGENADIYRANAAALKAELTALDEEFRSITEAAKTKKIYHGGRFSLVYFAEEYGLAYESAYDSCGSDTEPSVRQICSMIDEMRADGAKVVFYEELSNNSVAKLIADETGAKPLLLHSCHNLTTEEFESGVTYITLMKQNAENLREAIT
ncbi:MAG: zinc ABC transporter substrate-binding protein [Oscillospiraceae bacterium]|nr:zinc ABC transporter substrate-binding protein [Oscillospiraceae bacterium]